MDSDEELVAPKVILTANEMLQCGLTLVRYSEKRIGRVKQTSNTNTTRFKTHFGCNQIVAVQIFEDLQTTEVDDARLDDNKISAKYFLISLNFLFVYETEDRKEPIFDLSQKTTREWVVYYVKKVQALKHEKIIWPTINTDDIWILSVDCTDCPIEEIKHPIFSQDKELFSFKINGAGLRYELGIDLYRSNLIWLSGPHKPGKLNDKSIFLLPGGLKEKLESLGKKGLADKIYNGYPEQCSTFNAVDSDEVKEYKA